jgi:hypothetical protein
MNDLTKPTVSDPLELIREIGAPCTDLAAATCPANARLMNFGSDDPRFEELLFASEDDATKNPDQFSEIPFRVVYWTAKPIELTAEDTGEQFRAVRLVLIDDQGETVSFASAGALKSWDLIRSVRGNGPYTPALPCTFKRVSLGGKKFTWRIRPAK